MKPFVMLCAILFLVGCATVEKGAYPPKSSKEKKAFAQASREIQPKDVRADFHAAEKSVMAWAGVIKDIQYKETERTVQVAFKVDHRNFDWKDHGGSTPYQLSAEGDGIFLAGWTVQKPTRISYLKTLSKPGDMLIVYGTPYRMTGGSLIQLKASAIRSIHEGNYRVVEPEN